MPSRYRTYAARIALTFGVLILLDGTAFSASERRGLTTPVVPEQEVPAIEQRQQTSKEPRAPAVKQRQQTPKVRGPGPGTGPVVPSQTANRAFSHDHGPCEPYPGPYPPRYGKVSKDTKWYATKKWHAGPPTQLEVRLPDGTWGKKLTLVTGQENVPLTFRWSTREQNVYRAVWSFQLNARMYEAGNVGKPPAPGKVQYFTININEPDYPWGEVYVFTCSFSQQKVWHNPPSNGVSIEWEDKVYQQPKLSDNMLGFPDLELTVLGELKRGKIVVKNIGPGPAAPTKLHMDCTSFETDYKSSSTSDRGLGPKFRKFWPCNPWVLGGDTRRPDLGNEYGPYDPYRYDDYVDSFPDPPYEARKKFWGWMVPPLNRDETYEVNFPIPEGVWLSESKWSITVDPYNEVEELSEKNNKVEVDKRSKDDDDEW